MERWWSFARAYAHAAPGRQRVNVLGAWAAALSKDPEESEREAEAHALDQEKSDEDDDGRE